MSRTIFYTLCAALAALCALLLVAIAVSQPARGAEVCDDGASWWYLEAPTCPRVAVLGGEEGPSECVADGAEGVRLTLWAQGDQVLAEADGTTVAVPGP